MIINQQRFSSQLASHMDHLWMLFWPCCRPAQYSWIQSTEYPPARPTPATFHPAFRPSQRPKTPRHHLGLKMWHTLICVVQLLGKMMRLQWILRYGMFTQTRKSVKKWSESDHLPNFPLLDATFHIQSRVEIHNMVTEVKWYTYSPRACLYHPIAHYPLDPSGNST